MLNPPSAEWHLLRAACLESNSELGWRDLLSSASDWNALLSLAEQHGVLPLIAQAFSKIPEALPVEVSKTLRQSYQTNLHKSLFLSRELICILEKLSSSGIEVMPYKGVALAETVYGDIALRQSGDIDLLIRPKDLAAIRECVRELGYTPHFTLSRSEEDAYLKSGYECAFDGSAGRNLLEVQWAIQPGFYAVDIEMEELFQRAVPVTVAGYETKTPCPEDLFLILAIHAAKHLWGRLIWTCDLAQLSRSPSLNWKRIAAQATDLGVVRILRVSLKLAEDLLNSPIPNEADASLPPDAVATRLAEEIASHLANGVAFNVESVAYFRWTARLRERDRDKIRLISRLAFTPGPGEWAVVQLPKALFPLYRFVRLLRLAARVVQNRL